MCSEDSLYEAVNALGSQRLLTIDSRGRRRGGKWRVRCRKGQKGEVTADDWGQRGSWCPLTALSFPLTLFLHPASSPHRTSFRHVLPCPHINPPVCQALGSRVSSVRNQGMHMHPGIHQVSEIRGGSAGKAANNWETKDEAPASPQGPGRSRDRGEHENLQCGWWMITSHSFSRLMAIEIWYW